MPRPSPLRSTTGLVAETGGGNERIKCIKTLDTGLDTIDVNAAARTFTRAAGGLLDPTVLWPAIKSLPPVLQMPGTTR